MSKRAPETSVSPRWGTPGVADRANADIGAGRTIIGWGFGRQVQVSRRELGKTAKKLFVGC